MTAPSLLDELEEVVRLSELATPGPWVANDGELDTDLYWADGRMVADTLAEFADGLSDPPNASFVASAVNFIRTHHAEIAAMAKRLEAAERDARRYRYLRDSASKDDWDKMAFGCITGYQLDAYIDDATQEGEE
jgi:hypothetical protein